MRKKPDDYDNLPKRGVMKNRRNEYRRHYRASGIYRKINGYFHGTRVLWILKKYKGKSVDVAFSEYCKLVDVCQQPAFWEELEEPLYHYRYWYRRHWGRWYIDKNKNIQFEPRTSKKGPYYINSFDIRYGWINTTTGKEFLDYCSFVHHDNPTYEWGIVEGERREFANIGPKFKKYFAEQKTKKKKQKRDMPTKEYVFKHPVVEDTNDVL